MKITLTQGHVRHDQKPKVLTDEVQALLKALIAEDNQRQLHRNGGDAFDFRPSATMFLAISKPPRFVDAA